MSDHRKGSFVIPMAEHNKEKKDDSVVVPLGSSAEPPVISTFEQFSERIAGFVEEVVEFELNHLSNADTPATASKCSLENLKSKSILNVVRTKPDQPQLKSDQSQVKAEVTDFMSRKNQNHSGENT